MPLYASTLFERLEDGRSTPPVRTDPVQLSASILANLSTVFNARQGSCMTRPDYGLPDFNDALIKGPESMPVIARAIKAQIDRFEPRLTQVLVRPDHDPNNPLILRFQISARLRGLDGERIGFETTLSDDGFVRVKR